MSNQPDIQRQIQNALSNERNAKAKHDSKRALIGVFVVIPGAVFLAVGIWVGGRLLNLW